MLGDKAFQMGFYFLAHISKSAGQQGMIMNGGAATRGLFLAWRTSYRS